MAFYVPRTKDPWGKTEEGYLLGPRRSGPEQAGDPHSWGPGLRAQRQRHSGCQDPPRGTARCAGLKRRKGQGSKAVVAAMGGERVAIGEMSLWGPGAGRGPGAAQGRS